MTEAEELLKKWNGGILRNAKSKLAKELKVQNTNVSAWLNGRQRPSERAINKMSKLFGKTEKDIKELFENKNRPNIYQSARNIKGNNHQAIHSCNMAEIVAHLRSIDLAINNIWDKIKRD